MENFLATNGIRHVTSAASNGLAERAVQIVKRGLKKTKEGSRDWLSFCTTTLTD